jgi:hypothetical protein
MMPIEIERELQAPSNSLQLTLFRIGPAFEHMRYGEKWAHLGGVGGEPPTVLPRLLVLKNKCVKSPQARHIGKHL